MTDKSANLSLPYILPAQAQKHVTHNEALQALDAIVQLSVAGRDRSAPPASPHEGERHIVGATATGEWAGREGRIAAFQAGGWAIYEPRAGWLAWVEAENALLAWDGATWRPTGATDAAASERTARLGINTHADDTNRLAVRSAATLLTHDGAGHQLKLNKAAAGDTASVLFQTAFSGCAEFGTTGTDTFQVKVSADGNAWRAALSIHPATGNLAIGADPSAETLLIKTDAAFCSLRLERANTATRMRHFDGGSQGMDAIYDIDPLPGTGTASAEIRYFRNMATTGLSGVRILRGNGTATANSYVGANTDSYLNAAVGNVGIGTSAPTAKLHVNGALRLSTYPVETLPNAGTSGAGTVAFVSNAPGGATLALSDGNAWRYLAVPI